MTYRLQQPLQATLGLHHAGDLVPAILALLLCNAKTDKLSPGSHGQADVRADPE